jgi:hypothetical protein
MNFYKITPIINKNNRLVGSVNGKNIPNCNFFFNKMQQGDIIFDVPVFDYFFLQSYEDKKYWDLHLMDIHTGTGVFPIGNWLISDKLKQILEKFIIAKEYFFYKSLLFYKGNKLNYWLYQFIAPYRKMNKTKYINFKKSKFLSDKTLERLNIFDYTSYIEIEKKLKTDKDKIITSNILLYNHIDFISLIPIKLDILVSKRLKQAIEDMDITGFEFSELDYEVIVEE